jgi:rhodanese-related sulfurtransferase
MAAEKAVAAGYSGVIKRMEGGFLAWAAMGFDCE